MSLTNINYTRPQVLTVIYLKEKLELGWTSIASRFNVRFPDAQRTANALQATYSRKWRPDVRGSNYPASEVAAQAAPLNTTTSKAKTKASAVSHDGDTIRVATSGPHHNTNSNKSTNSAAVSSKKRKATAVLDIPTAKKSKVDPVEEQTQNSKATGRLSSHRSAKKNMQSNMTGAALSTANSLVGESSTDQGSLSQENEATTRSGRTISKKRKVDEDFDMPSSKRVTTSASANAPTQNENKKTTVAKSNRKAPMKHIASRSATLPKDKKAEEASTTKHATTQQEPCSSDLVGTMNEGTTETNITSKQIPKKGSKRVQKPSKGVQKPSKKVQKSSKGVQKSSKKSKKTSSITKGGNKTKIVWPDVFEVIPAGSVPDDDSDQEDQEPAASVSKSKSKMTMQEHPESVKDHDNSHHKESGDIVNVQDASASKNMSNITEAKHVEAPSADATFHHLSDGESENPAPAKKDKGKGKVLWSEGAEVLYNDFSDHVSLPIAVTHNIHNRKSLKEVYHQSESLSTTRQYNEQYLDTLTTNVGSSKDNDFVDVLRTFKRTEPVVTLPSHMSYIPLDESDSSVASEEQSAAPLSQEVSEKHTHPSIHRLMPLVDYSSSDEDEPDTTTNSQHKGLGLHNPMVREADGPNYAANAGNLRKRTTQKKNKKQRKVHFKDVPAESQSSSDIEEPKKVNATLDYLEATMNDIGPSAKDDPVPREGPTYRNPRAQGRVTGRGRNRGLDSNGRVVWVRVTAQEVATDLDVPNPHAFPPKGFVLEQSQRTPETIRLRRLKPGEEGYGA